MHTLHRARWFLVLLVVATVGGLLIEPAGATPTDSSTTTATQQANCAGTVAQSWGTTSIDWGAIGDACLSNPYS